jgi:hypothetical protein
LGELNKAVVCVADRSALLCAPARHRPLHRSPNIFSAVIMSRGSVAAENGELSTGQRQQGLPARRRVGGNAPTPSTITTTGKWQQILFLRCSDVSVPPFFFSSSYFISSKLNKVRFSCMLLWHIFKLSHTMHGSPRHKILARHGYICVSVLD